MPSAKAGRFLGPLNGGRPTKSRHSLNLQTQLLCSSARSSHSWNDSGMANLVPWGIFHPGWARPFALTRLHHGLATGGERHAQGAECPRLVDYYM